MLYLPRYRISTSLRVVIAAFFYLFAAVTAVNAQTVPTSFALTNADASNTTAVGGTPDPFNTTVSGASGYTNGNLWLRRQGVGFDLANNREIFQKDANGGVGDAVALQTVISGLVPGQSYGVYVAFISVPTETWQVRASLDSSDYETFTPTSPVGYVYDLGRSSSKGSNRHQYLGLIGNATAQPDGTITVYVDDSTGSGNTTRTWYEGVGVSDPVTLPEAPSLPGGAVEVAPDGAWTWFNDERAIFHNGCLYAGYVRADGHVGISRLDPTTATSSHTQLSTSRSVQRDDHNNPSITPLADGRLLVVYSKHNGASEFYTRTSTIVDPATDTDWGAEQIFNVPQNNTYANTYRLSDESDLLYQFHRCVNFNPTLSRSDDEGATWGAATHFIKVGNDSSIRPYPRYVSNHTDRIDLIYTEGHPRAEDNSIYHMYYTEGAFRKTDGTLIKNITELPIDHAEDEQGSVVYTYSDAAYGTSDGPDDWIPAGRGWTWDIHYEANGNPVCVFQVQRENTTGTAWTHDRIYYYYARWDGTAWQKKFIAQAGRPLYSRERDYGGGMCIDPEDPRVVYISSNAASPFALNDIDNVPLNADSRYELYRGVTLDGGQTFTWEAITENSAKDNMRPIVPENHGYDRALVWFYGTYNTYQNYDTQVLALLKNDRAVSD
ncbi:MAG: BNR-4 repeat-containing protein [Opitutaceae bacterium]